MKIATIIKNKVVFEVSYNENIYDESRIKSWFKKMKTEDELEEICSEVEIDYDNYMLAVEALNK